MKARDVPTSFEAEGTKTVRESRPSVDVTAEMITELAGSYKDVSIGRQSG
jgi:hypothetical protein